MQRKQLIAIVAVLAVVCVVGASYAVIFGGDRDSRETLIVETSPDFAPFDYIYDGEFVGIDMDIVRAVCDDMGYNVEFRQNYFDSILISVPQGKADIGASGFTISEERAEKVLFSDPYYQIKQVVVAPIDTHITAKEDLATCTISVQNGTTGADYAAKVSNNPQANVITQTSYPTVVLDLLNGKADCEVVDEAVGISQVATHPDELIVLDILDDAPDEYYGFIFAKDNTELQEKFNESLNKLMDNGLVQQIIDYYEENGFSSDTPSFFSYNGTLVVETSPDFPPYEYLYGNEYTGIDMDIMRAIGYDINYRIEFRQNVFDSITLSVQQGKCDLGASGFTISEDRLEQVDFSTPYAEIHQVLVVQEGSTIQTLEDLRGASVSVQTGTSGYDYAVELNGRGMSLDIKTYKDYPIALLDVIQGKTQAEIVDSTVAKAQVAKNPGLKILDILDAKPESYGFIFQKGNSEVYDLVNASLEKLIANGTVDKIVQYYADAEYNEVPSYYSTHEIDDDDESSGTGWWAEFKDRFHNDFLKNDRYMYIFDGLKNTLIITAVALVIGLVLGSVVAMVRSTHDMTGKLRIVNAICHLYITVIRGTPVMVQLLLIYYVVFVSSDNGILIASVAFGINSGAYVAEVIRSGITAVPKGQMEACRSLGMSNRMAMTNVILPQAFRNIMPAIGNEGISLLKETSVAGYIGIMDLTRGADIIRGQTYDALLPILVAAAIYLAIVLVLTFFIRRLERRLNSAY